VSAPLRFALQSLPDFGALTASIASFAASFASSNRTLRNSSSLSGTARFMRSLNRSPPFIVALTFVAMSFAFQLFADQVQRCVSQLEWLVSIVRPSNQFVGNLFATLCSTSLSSGIGVIGSIGFYPGRDAGCRRAAGCAPTFRGGAQNAGRMQYPERSSDTHAADDSP
jgi:hypothetical protein